MKRLIRTIAVAVLVAGASQAFAAPLSAPAFRISLALPTAQFDFSDMDLRDEFNRPVAAPAVVRERFEALLNRELNRLLIQNLTPVRRAFLDLLDSARDAFGPAYEAARRQVARAAAAILRHEPVLVATVLWASSMALRAASRLSWPEENISRLLVLRLIASTRLLR